MTVLDRLREALTHELSALAREGQLGTLHPQACMTASFTLDRPKRPEHGDYATNAVALKLGTRRGLLSQRA